MVRSSIKLFLCSLLLASAGAQEYNDYQDYGQGEYAQDNLYHDYAMRQQEKEIGKP